MSRTLTFPFDDKKMWWKLIALTHPDRGGEHELCVWAQNVREHVLKGGAATQSSLPSSPEPRVVYEDSRVPFPTGSTFEELTAAALKRAGTLDELYSRLLLLLEDCYLLDHLVHEEQRGASYKRLAAIGHMVGMDKAQRIGWYRVAESIPLADRPAGHILSRLKREAA